MKLKWGWKINIIELIALIISLSAFFISYHVAFGQSKLKVEYAVSGKETMYWYNTNTIAYEFLVINSGYGSTVYVVEPDVSWIPSNKTKIVKVGYNDEEKLRQIYKPDLKSIEPKSSHLVNIIISNVSENEMPEELQVLIRDIRNNDHLWLKFTKPPINVNFLLNVFEN
ncbi:hypothetical protein HYW20_08005 [Candidatus Woesearchaeota archaeon]|nr:hypothetical protein [Candidatus Woesearchaeota archaeon]